MLPQAILAAGREFSSEPRAESREPRAGRPQAHTQPPGELVCRSGPIRRVWSELALRRDATASGWLRLVKHVAWKANNRGQVRYDEW